jgi:prepilin-type N-terminal cleavage/methylation domain-containing protein
MKKGFTLVEMMMVMVVMAIIASLAVGAAVKSMKQGKIQKINATRVILEMALMNYRTVEEHWPLVSGENTETNKVVYSGTKNALVFAPLFESRKRQYLDPSALLTKVDGLGVISMREALERKFSPATCPIGYQDPDKGSNFKYYKVTIDYSFDTAKVSL